MRRWIRFNPALLGANEGIISIYSNNPNENLFILRVLTTGTTPTGFWPVEILEVFPCDVNGEPQYTFVRGRGAGFNVTVRNNGASPQHVIVVLNFFYSNGVPFKSLIMFDKIIEGGTIESRRRWIEEFIPSNAPIGPAYIYANALNNWTQYEGIAWCPEKSTSFNIVSSGGGTATYETQSTINSLQSTTGNFNLTFKIPDNGGILGNYTVYANSWYNSMYAQQVKTFEALLFSDVTRDGTVDMADISIIIDKFMATPDDPRWDPRCDINNDYTIDMADISIAVDDFLKWGTYWARTCSSLMAHFEQWLRL